MPGMLSGGDGDLSFHSKRLPVPSYFSKVVIQAAVPLQVKVAFHATFTNLTGLNQLPSEVSLNSENVK